MARQARRGASPFSDEASALPTPLPRPALTLLSIDALRQQGGGATAVPAAATAAPEPTATPIPTVTPEPVEEETPQPTVAPTVVPTAGAAARAEQVAGTAVTALSEMETESDEQPNGGSCGVPTGRAGGVVEMSSIAMLAGLAWLWVRRRRR